jgi:serine phosphatase RsbU (regulator of sigma subunit)
VAAAVSGPVLTLVAGIQAVVIAALFAAEVPVSSAAHQRAIVAFSAVAGVTAAAVLTSLVRARGDRRLAQVRLVAEAAQQVLLRPVPREVGPVRFAVRYLSAAREARVGGDLYEVAVTSRCLRLVVGDAKGKGLPAVQSAAALLGVFREAAYEEDSLTAIAARIESSLARQLTEEQFITAVLAEISPDGTKMELLSCGHPPPLLLGPGGVPRFADLSTGALPLGLGDLAAEPRIPLAIPLSPGDQVLFYTDGATEARNRAGEFFSLTESTSLRSQHRSDALVDSLSAEVTRHVGHAPADDITLLLVATEEGG